MRCSLELDRPAPLPAGTPLQLTFVTSGARGAAYDYEVDVDNALSAKGTTTENRFSVPVEFTTAGTSIISVRLTLNDKSQTFLFSLVIS